MSVLESEALATVLTHPAYLSFDCDLSGFPSQLVELAQMSEERGKQEEEGQEQEE